MKINTVVFNDIGKPGLRVSDSRKTVNLIEITDSYIVIETEYNDTKRRITELIPLSSLVRLDLGEQPWILKKD